MITHSLVACIFLLLSTSASAQSNFLTTLNSALRANELSDPGSLMNRFPGLENEMKNVLGPKTITVMPALPSLGREPSVVSGSYKDIPADMLHGKTGETAKTAPVKSRTPVNSRGLPSVGSDRQNGTVSGFTEYQKEDLAIKREGLALQGVIASAALKNVAIGEGNLEVSKELAPWTKANTLANISSATTGWLNTGLNAVNTLKNIGLGIFDKVTSKAGAFNRVPGSGGPVPSPAPALPKSVPSLPAPSSPPQIGPYIGD